MKHRLFSLLLIIPLLLCSCQAAPEEPPAEPEIRAVWISCYDWEPVAGKTEADYRARTDAMFSRLRTAGFNTAFVHLRAFSDAFYPSKLFPVSSYLTGERGGKLPFDPFALMLESAAASGIAVHGWINPFRISNDPDPAALCSGEPAKDILASGDPDGRIAVLDNGIYYNPAAPENHALILAGVKEILTNYDVAGMHIDDYFYPSEDPAIDHVQYEAYRAAGGELPLLEWRTQAVNAFVSALYAAVKAQDPAITVSISPAGSLENNRQPLCADVETWLSTPGYADWILPQLYFGFTHETLPFSALLSQWASLPRAENVTLLCGLGAYKLGREDPYAGGGKTEWIDDPGLLARQLEAVRANSAYSGFAFFSYSDLLRAGAQAGVSAMLALL